MFLQGERSFALLEVAVVTDALRLLMLVLVLCKRVMQTSLEAHDLLDARVQVRFLRSDAVSGFLERCLH